jgi:hypothetical protein
LDQFRRASSITGIGGVDHHDDHRGIATRDGGIRRESVVVSPRRSLIFSALTCWFLELAGWIGVAGFAPWSSAWSRFRSRDRQAITTVNRREDLNGRDAPT